MGSIFEHLLRAARVLVLAVCAALLCGPAGAGQTPNAAAIEAAVKRVNVGGLEFPVLDIGSGPAVLLLHGFPDTHALWRKQVGPLVAAGYRVVAPDLRGFGDAPRPQAIADYHPGLILGDVIGLLDVLSINQARVVGHDWGAVVSWLLAMHFPDRVERLMVMSVGAPGNPLFYAIEQREKSWYTLFFQFEGVAEEALQRDNWALLRGMMRNEGDIEQAIERFSTRPGLLTAGLNWYRAFLKPQRQDPKAPPVPRVKAHVLGVWSDGDHFLTEAQMKTSGKLVSGNWRYERVAGAGHWMMLDRPEAVTRLMLGFLGD
ncbi:MAG: alpha/beta hydrolase [Burkholderiaceae bacterium]|nr:alpha/beta hydrolase [Burkholderiaceae bacterium]